MKTVHVQELSAEKFALYGTFADMLHAAGPHIGTNPIEFYRDMTTVYSPCASVGLSITKVYLRPLVIDTYEYHNTCAEAMLPLTAMRISTSRLPVLLTMSRMTRSRFSAFRREQWSRFAPASGTTARSAWIQTPCGRSSSCRNGSMPMTVRS